MREPHSPPPPLAPQMVLHLKQKVAELRDELALATGEEREGELSEEEAEK